MDLSTEVGGAVADTARDVFMSQLVPRVLSDDPTHLRVQGEDQAHDTEMLRFIRVLAAELSSPDHNVRAQVRFLLLIGVSKICWFKLH